MCTWLKRAHFIFHVTSSLRVISAVLFGAMAVGEANSFAPNYAKAKMSASHLMMLLNTEPAIDNLSEHGESPVHNARIHTILQIQLLTHMIITNLFFLSLLF